MPFRVTASIFPQTAEVRAQIENYKRDANNYKKREDPLVQSATCQDKTAFIKAKNQLTKLIYNTANANVTCFSPQTNNRLNSAYQLINNYTQLSIKIYNAVDTPFNDVAVEIFFPLTAMC